MSWREPTFPKTRGKWINIKSDLRGVMGGLRWFMVESKAWFYTDGLKLSANNSWILNHPNAPEHTALSVSEFLATKQITV